MLMDVTYGNTERIDAVGRAACIAVVLVALLFEYRQVWQSALDRLFDRNRGAESSVPTPHAPTPDP
jgi:hypothetical protein